MPSGKIKNNFTIHNKVQIVRGGADYFRIIEEIADSAAYSLHLQTYIFDEDETGTKIADALVRAAKRNVLVYLLLDGYASQNLSKVFIARLKDAGIQFGFFKPLFKSDLFYLGRRLHHKVVVADGAKCLVAGINISNRYNDLGETMGWLDWAVYAEGEIAGKLNDICLKTWDRSAFRKKCIAINNPAYPMPEQQCMVRPRTNDWVYKRTEITRTYRELFRDARTEVTVMTSYFWPPQKLLSKMAGASRRGVRTRLILTAKADVPFAKNAEKYLYKWLFRNGIEVYEYQQNILHGKLAVRDREFITMGSYNFNNISAFASVELNLDISDTSIASDVADKLQHIIDNDCLHITDEHFNTSNNLFKKFAFYCSYRIIHTIFLLFTFYFSQRREKE